jgi:hypothetical protein
MRCGMTYRKGERTAADNEKHCPYAVELLVPEGGFGAKLAVIALFHSNFGIEELKGRWRRRSDRDYARWCFKDPQHASSFQALLGGELVVQGAPR